MKNVANEHINEKVIFAIVHWEKWRHRNPCTWWSGWVSQSAFSLGFLCMWVGIPYFCFPSCLSAKVWVGIFGCGFPPNKPLHTILTTKLMNFFSPMILIVWTTVFLPWFSESLLVRGRQRNAGLGETDKRLHPAFKTWVLHSILHKTLFSSHFLTQQAIINPAALTNPLFYFILTLQVNWVGIRNLWTDFGNVKEDHRNLKLLKQMMPLGASLVAQQVKLPFGCQIWSGPILNCPPASCCCVLWGVVYNDPITWVPASHMGKPSWSSFLLAYPSFHRNLGVNPQIEDHWVFIPHSLFSLSFS